MRTYKYTNTNTRQYHQHHPSSSALIGLFQHVSEENRYDTWEIPLAVRHVEQQPQQYEQQQRSRRVVFVDKPLPLRRSTIRHTNVRFYKAAMVVTKEANSTF